MEQTTMLHFIKALSNADRLRVLGALAQKPLSADEISQNLGMAPQDVTAILAVLAQSGRIAEQQGIWQLDDIPQRLPDGESYSPAPDLSEKPRKILAAYLNADGSFKQLPAKPSKLQIILDYLLQAFTPGAIYTEKEVNMLIRRFHLDTAGLRRDLIDRGMLQRKSDGSQYWRPQ